MDWSSFWGAFLGTLLNLFEIGLLLRLLKEIKQLLKEFKFEGDKNEWLK